MGFQSSVNQIIGSVAAASAIPNLMAQRKAQIENRAYTASRRKLLAIKRDAKQAGESRLQERKELLKNQKAHLSKIYVAGQEISPGTDLYNKLIKAGEKNGTKK